MHTKDFDASAYEMIFHVVPEEAGFGHRHVFTDVAGGGDVVEVEVQGGALPQHTIIAHNRSVAMEAKKRRLEGGARIDSTNSTLCNINLFSLRSLEMDSILPDILRAGVVRRSVMPHPPTQWCTVKSWPVIIDHLKISNPHPRDARLVFEARDHMYFWDGTPTAGSVTKLIHTFTQPFDPDCVIAGMRAGANWPRPEYLKPYVAEDTLCFLRDSVHTKELVNLLCIKPRPNVEICQLVKNIARQHPDLHNIVDLISMSDATIKKVWTRNADDASKQGTWMHMELECLLNGGFLSHVSTEVGLFAKFIDAKMSGVMAFRTEWAVFATEENLAGSIDFVGVRSDGSLVLCDWKRSKCMWNKCNGFGKFMRSPVAHLPDAALWHYRLQLNIYCRILEKYYGATIHSMFVVGCNPDNGEFPFVDEVPFMVAEANALLEFQIAATHDVRGGSSQWEEQVLEFERICSEFQTLLAHSPTLFGHLADLMCLDVDLWECKVAEIRQLFASHLPLPENLEQRAVAHSKKRLAVYMSFLRQCSGVGTSERVSLVIAFPNPFLSTSKRRWEAACLESRRLLRSEGRRWLHQSVSSSDALGGGSSDM